MELYNPEGKLVKRVRPVVAPGGSFTGSLEDIFGTGTKILEGYVKVVSDSAISGYGVRADSSSYSSVVGQTPKVNQNLLSPHFFVDHTGFNTSLRILNTEAEERIVTIRCLDDSGRLISEKKVKLNPGRLAKLNGREILKLGNAPITKPITGYLELKTDGKSRTRLATSIHYSSPHEKSATTVPMLNQSYRETVFPQIAQTLDDSLYTGLVIVNPHFEDITVSIEAYKPDGTLQQTKELNIKAKSRLVGMLRSDTFFGRNYHQVKGHVRVRSSKEIYSYAAFGDAKGEFLATVEGQRASLK
jgi:hypothetical protein